MKRIICLLLCLTCVVLAGCGGNYSQVGLNEPTPLPEDGIVTKSELAQLRDDNAIGVYTGTSDGLTYEWTIFGSDITEPKDVGLSLSAERTQQGVAVTFHTQQTLGFPALLSLRLTEKWPTAAAAAYAPDGTEVYSVSVTGSKTTILNLAVSETVASCVVVPTEDEASQPEVVTAPQTSETVVVTETETLPTDDYLSAVTSGDDRVYSDGSQTGQDKYQTDPVPEGKPLPVEPEDQEIDSEKTYSCTISIECSTILNNLDDLDPDKRELVPSDGVILAPTTVSFSAGESVFDVLQRVCREKGIHLESSWTPVYNSAYIEGIHNLYEFDCGSLSGWMYCVNGWYPNYGCSRYQLADGETVQWRYTCDLGKDIGCTWLE